MQHDDHTSATTTATHTPAAEAERVVIYLLTRLFEGGLRHKAETPFSLFVSPHFRPKHIRRNVAQSGSEYLVRDQGVVGSNPTIPTINPTF